MEELQTKHYTDKRPVVTFRIKRERHEKLKTVAKKYKLKKCKIVEVLVEKFLRGETILNSKDFEV